jgi:myo-inositol-1(or 4)-monophosphatase
MMYKYPEMARDMVDLIEKGVAPLLKTQEAHKITGEGAGGQTRLLDKQAEDAVMKYVKENGIACELVTEESGIKGEGDLTIILDPIDGTTNALSGLPFFSVSLAFWEERKYGFVKNLFTGDIYEAFDNGNPLKNGRTMHPDCTESIGCLYIGEGFRNVLPLIDAWRCFGSLALELSYVAAGNLMALVDLRGKARIVDIAGAQVIAEAAGVRVTDERGRNPFEDGFFRRNGTFTGKKVICALPELHEKILDALHG